LFADYQFDTSIGWFNVRHRVYIPRVGWLRRDPIGLSAGTNLYEYVQSNPAARTDPLGLRTWCEWMNLGCTSAFFGCFCRIVGIADVILSRFGRTSPLGLIVEGIVNIVDCLCDSFSGIQQICLCSPESKEGPGLIAIAGCAFDFVGAFGALGKLLEKFENIPAPPGRKPGRGWIFEALLEVLEETGLEDTEGTGGGGIRHCISNFSNLGSGFSSWVMVEKCAPV